MKVICMAARVGTDFSHAPGQIIEIDPDELVTLLEAGHVRLLEPEAAESPADQPAAKPAAKTPRKRKGE